MSIHIKKNGTEYGPHSEQEVRQLHDERVIESSDIVVLEDGSEMSVAEFLKTAKTRLVIPAKAKPEGETGEASGSTLKRFMVAKGMLVRRDNLSVGAMRCDHGGRLALETAILTIGNAVTSKKTYGAVLRYEGDDGTKKGMDHIDFDELDEIVGAVDFMLDLAPRMAREACEYTEVKYASKEGTSFGFFQTPNGQQAFVSTGVDHESAFLPVGRLKNLGDLFKRSKDMLVASGAEEEG